MKDEGIQGIEMHQQRVGNVTAENVESELPIESRAIQEMGDQVIAVGSNGSIGLLRKPVNEALADVPIGSVDGDVAVTVTALLEQSARTIAVTVSATAPSTLPIV